MSSTIRKPQHANVQAADEIINIIYKLILVHVDVYELLTWIYYY